MIESLLSFLHLHPEYLIASIFFISLFESLAVVGIIIPGVGLLASLSVLAGNLELNVYWMLGAGLAGAILGDSISYYLGRYFQYTVPRLWPFTRHPHWINNGHEFFIRYGAHSIFIGRFIGPIRPIIPLVAGMMNMPASSFIRWNILSALCWSPVYLLPGYLLGEHLNWKWLLSWKGFLLLLLMSITAIGISLWLKRSHKKAS
jgi:undecaprenyl-diphosphatase